VTPIAERRTLRLAESVNTLREKARAFAANGDCRWRERELLEAAFDVVRKSQTMKRPEARR
jgi:hypothetical protein